MTDPESGATVEPTDDLRRAVIHAIARRQSLAAKPGGDPADLADAAIAAYRKHPDGAAKDRHPSEHALNNLLAIIHRDGGHHTEDVGINSSVEDAHLVWAELITRAEKVEAERDAATRWQPIETAPRDGSWLLGAFGASGLCIFRRHDVGGRYESWVTHEGAACKAPQYWMPLPANPWRAKP